MASCQGCLPKGQTLKRVQHLFYGCTALASKNQSRTIASICGTCLNARVRTRLFELHLSELRASFQIAKHIDLSVSGRSFFRPVFRLEGSQAHHQRNMCSAVYRSVSTKQMSYLHGASGAL